MNNLSSLSPTGTPGAALHSDESIPHVPEGVTCWMLVRGTNVQDFFVDAVKIPQVKDILNGTFFPSIPTLALQGVYYGPAPKTTGPQGTCHMLLKAGSPTYLLPIYIGMNFPDATSCREYHDWVRAGGYERLLASRSHESPSSIINLQHAEAPQQGKGNVTQELPASLQLSSRVPLVKDTPKEITILKKGKPKECMDEKIAVQSEDNVSGQMELAGTVAMFEKLAISRVSKMTTGAALLKGQRTHQSPQLPTNAQGLQPTTLNSAGNVPGEKPTMSSAELLRTEVQRLSVVKPSMVHSNKPQLPQQPGQENTQRTPQSKLATASVKALSVKFETNAATQSRQELNTVMPTVQHCYGPGNGPLCHCATEQVANGAPGSQQTELPQWGLLAPQLPAKPAAATVLAPPRPMFVFGANSSGPPVQKKAVDAKQAPVKQAAGKQPPERQPSITPAGVKEAPAKSIPEAQVPRVSQAPATGAPTTAGARVPQTAQAPATSASVTTGVHDLKVPGQAPVTGTSTTIGAKVSHMAQAPSTGSPSTTGTAMPPPDIVKSTDHLLHNILNTRFPALRAMDEWMVRTQSMTRWTMHSHLIDPRHQDNGTFRFVHPPPSLTLSRPLVNRRAQRNTPAEQGYLEAKFLLETGYYVLGTKRVRSHRRQE